MKLSSLMHGGVSSPQVLQYLTSVLSVKNFVRTYFRDPMDSEAPYIPEVWQDRLYDSVEFGDLDVMVKSPRGFGKTVGIASCGAALVILDRCWVGFFSMSQDQSNEMMRYAKYFIDTCTYPLVPDFTKDTQVECRFTNSSRLFSFPQSEARVRGKRVHYAFVDEMSRIEEEFIRTVIRPCLRRVGKKFCGASTPFGQTGEFYRCCVDTENYEILDLGPLDVSWITPEDLMLELKRYGVFLEPSAAKLPKEEFLEVLDEVTDLASAQELFGKFIPAGDCVFPPALIGKMQNMPELKPIVKGRPNTGYVLGGDFGKQRDRTVFCIGHVENGRVLCDYMESWLKDEIPRRKEFYPFVQDRVVDLCSKFNVDLFVPDALNVGDAVIDNILVDLNELEYPPNIYMHTSGRKGFITTSQNKFELIDNMVGLAQGDRFKFPQHDNKGEFKEFESELLSFTYEIYGKRTIRIHYGVQNAHDDRVIAGALMAWGASKFQGEYMDVTSGGAVSGERAWNW